VNVKVDVNGSGVDHCSWGVHNDILISLVISFGSNDVECVAFHLRDAFYLPYYVKMPNRTKHKSVQLYGRVTLVGNHLFPLLGITNVEEIDMLRGVAYVSFLHRNRVKALIKIK
jgi:hypothetical protein